MITWWQSILVGIAGGMVYDFGKGFWAGLHKKHPATAWSCPHCVFAITINGSAGLHDDDAQRMLDSLALAHLDSTHDGREVD